VSVWEGAFRAGQVSCHAVSLDTCVCLWNGWFCRFGVGRKGDSNTQKALGRLDSRGPAALLVVRESEALSSSRKARSAFRTTPLRCLRVRASSTPPPPFSPPGDSLRSSPEPCAHSVRARHQSQHSTAALPSPSSREERGPWCPRERSERGGSRDAKRLSSCGKSPIFQQLRRACSPGGLKGRGGLA